MTPVRARSARARAAIAAAVLWLAGVEALPAFHEALHDRLAPHVHIAGAIITVSFEDTTHVHPDGTIHYVARRGAPCTAPAGHPMRDGRPRIGDVVGHAAGLAHHAAAIAPVAPPTVHPLPVDRRPVLVALRDGATLVSRAAPAATARGPPRLA
ncbi:MAG TPA: hypothetical protein VHW23_17095 [Kofleriaceae bacterium]|jgi:hypothetical protein|nr:hypothetical protein [Kofleriaceae bacterium]